jgi:hypothetical protein
MAYEKTWAGDWPARVRERVKARGFASVTEYGRHRTGVPLLELAHELGPDDVAAHQIRCLLIEEALRSKTFPQMARDLFERELRKALPEGWQQPLDDATRYEVVGAISDWYAELQDYVDHPATMAAGKEFLNAELPVGWLPEGPDDPVIVAFVDRCLGRAPS